MEFLSLKGGCTGSFESIHVKMSHCWKSHVAAYFYHTYRTVNSTVPILPRNLIITEEQRTSVNDAAPAIYAITEHVNLNLIQYVKFDLSWSALTFT